jgi:PAS domain S-box-containing protein
MPAAPRRSARRRHSGGARKAASPKQARRRASDIAERKRTQTEQARLAAMVDASPDAILGLAADGRIIAWNGGAEAMFGTRTADAIGRRAADLILEPEDVGHLINEARHDRIVRAWQTTGRRARGGRIPLSITAAPAKSDDGKLIAVSIVAHDITARREMEERQTLLMRELSHRVKNSLATAQSMLRLSYREGTPPADLIRDFGDRLQSLAQCHELLSENDWRGASLKSIVEAEIAPYAFRNGPDDNVSIAGRDIVVAPRIAESLALVFHELATNAAKYGAMSTPRGRVAVEWRVAGSRKRPKLEIAWTEREGPPVAKPETSGLGRKLIEKELRHGLGASTRLDFRRSGIEWRASLPLDHDVTWGGAGHGLEG